MSAQPTGSESEGRPRATANTPTASTPTASTPIALSGVGHAPQLSYPEVPSVAGGKAGQAGEVAKVDDVEEALRDVVDPELGINVVDLGLIYGLTVDDTTNIATIDMTLTSAACPLTDVIEDQIRSSLAGLVNDFRLNWVWMPPWTTEKITDEGREQLQALGFNI